MKTAKLRRSTRRSEPGAGLGEHHRAQHEGPRKRDAQLDTGQGMPSKPIAARAMTIGNVTGSSHIAGAPSWAPQRPTEIIARMWSHRRSGERNRTGSRSAAPDLGWAPAMAGEPEDRQSEPRGRTKPERAEGCRFGEGVAGARPAVKPSPDLTSSVSATIEVDRPMSAVGVGIALRVRLRRRRSASLSEEAARGS